MALTDDEKLYTKVILGMETDTTLLDTRFTELTTSEETLLKKYIVDYQAIEIDTTLINAEGANINPDRKRRFLRSQTGLIMKYQIDNSLARA